MELGEWALRQACADRQHWQEQFGSDLGMSVNVSVHQLMSAGLADVVRAALADTSMVPSMLTLEVTESVFAGDRTRARLVLDELKLIGVRLGLDDFGTGYSSLGYLHTLPIDTIKLDRSFVADLSEQDGSQEIVTAVIDMGHRLGMTVVAEGVETARQYQRVRELGADLCQGFYLARPVRAEQVASLISEQSDVLSGRDDFR